MQGLIAPWIWHQATGSPDATRRLLHVVAWCVRALEFCCGSSQCGHFRAQVALAAAGKRRASFRITFFSPHVVWSSLTVDRVRVVPGSFERLLAIRAFSGVVAPGDNDRWNIHNVSECVAAAEAAATALAAAPDAGAAFLRRRADAGGGDGGGGTGGAGAAARAAELVVELALAAGRFIAPAAAAGFFITCAWDALLAA